MALLTKAKGGKGLDFAIPLLKKPASGSTPFDATYTNLEDGLVKVQRHLGNKIVHIDYK